VVDGAADTLRKRIPLGGSMWRLQYHRPADKLYCSGDSVVRVIDCTRDELVAAIPLAPGDMCSNPAENKVYCSVSRGPAEPGTVAVIDPRADTVLSRIAVAPRPGELFYDSPNNRVYVTHPQCETLSVIDCATDSLLHFIRVPRDGRVAGFSPASNKLYLFAGTQLVVVDCAADTVRRVIPVGEYAAGRNAYDSVRNRLHVIAGSPRAVQVVDCATDSIVDVVLTGTWSGYPVWNPFNRRLYCSTYDEGRIAVLHDPLGVEEGLGPQAARRRPEPTIVRGVLRVGSRPTAGGSRQELLDAAGRVVMKLLPGSNDVRRLAPGIYFVRHASGIAKVAVTR
jgi:hypothetical protein